MPYRAERPDLYIGTSVGDGQCVALVERAAHAPRTVFWHRGEKVEGNQHIQPGTVIATFDDASRYTNSTNGTSHAAIYVGQDHNGIIVIDQWKHRNASGQLVTQMAHQRTIFFKDSGRYVDQGENCYIVR